jgi:hypothetical protein
VKDSPTKVVLHPNPKMLLQIAIEPEILQVHGDAPHPGHGVFGEVRCPVCAVRMHGHGWRTRSFFDTMDQGVPVWVHRCICPVCRLTYTLLPAWVHALKRYSMETIRKVLCHRISRGCFSGKLGVQRSLQRSWWSGFLRRMQASGNRPEQAVLLDACHKIGQTMASPPGVWALRRREDLVAWWHSRPPSHQRLPAVVCGRLY